MIICADARRIPLADETVQCVVTSPPYWGLRKYAGEQELDWNDWRGSYGLEPTIEMYVQHTVEILREVRRVLRVDGVCFWNIGDGYATRLDGGQTSTRWLDSIRAGIDHEGTRDHSIRQKRDSGLKPKDLCLIPQRVALVAQADGWWVRSDIIWAKPNPMPESCKDRPTDAYEHILMLTKSARYYWDAEAVAEPSIDQESLRGRNKRNHDKFARHDAGGLARTRAGFAKIEPGTVYAIRNLRNVWTFPTQPYKGAHFATFPEELPKRCILAASKPGDVVLDPFAGSGTTGRVAIALGRVPVMLDLAYGSEYRELAERRTSEVQIEAFA